MGTKGFTLLEAVFAIALFTIAFAEILNLQSRSVSDAILAKQYNTVAQLARNKVIETEVKIRGKPFAEVKREEEGTFPEPNQDFRWTVKIDEFELPSSLGGASAGGEGQAETDMSRMVTQSISKYLSQALRQVTVTILWKKGNKDQKFSVGTYWVDLNREFTLN